MASPTPGSAAATVAVRGDEREALVELDINGVAKGDIAAFVRGDAVVGVDERTLERAGVPAAGAAGFERDARRFVDPTTLGPRIRATYDPNQLVLSLVIASVGVQRMDFSAPQPAADFAHPSASLDYDLLGIGGVERQLSLSGAVVAGRDQIVAQGVVGNANARPTAFFERDDPERRFEYEAGQFLTSADADLPSIFVAGVAAMRDFSLTPLQPAYPQPVYAGVADEPSVADVYVGGVLQRSVPVAPGPFALGGIPDSTGSNVRIVLRDAQGIVRTIYGSGFLDIALLAAGTTDRSYTFGEDLDTGRVVLDGSYRLGISDRWTAGLHVRDEGGLLTDALSSDVNLGSMQFHLGAIETGTTFGYDARASLVSGRSRISVGYADLAPSLAEETPVLPNRDLSIVAVRNMGHVDFSAELTREQQPGSAAAESIVANATAALPHGISGTISLENDSSGGRSVARRISLQFSGSRARPGANTVDSAYVGVSPQGETLDVRSSPVGLVGPHAELRLGQGYSLFDYGYASTDGVVDASLVQDGHGYSGSYELRGAVAVIDGHVKLARTLEDGFALVETPGLSHTPIYANGRFVGRTGSDGSLLVGDLESYEPAMIDVHPEDLALDVQMDSVRTTVVPPRRGGAVATFTGRTVTLVQGHVDRAADGSFAASSTIDFAKGSEHARARLDELDDFVVDRLTPGRWTFSVGEGFGERRCGGFFTVPSRHRALVDLGSLRCQAQSASR